MEWLLTIVVLAWYCSRMLGANPSKADWHRAIAATLLWPFSLFMKRYR